ncbi:MAG: hypothetical protein MK116_06145 [Phycisphaerales bacterium]|nr:hypothetical protein [Phycisphaerales bacterium]
MTTHIVLAGPRAVGKTTIGRTLAAARGVMFIDLDDRVLSTFEDSTVSEVWRLHGESAWRAAESRVLGEVLAEPPAVIALGGGVPTIPEACQQLNHSRDAGHARVLLLEASPAVLADRLADGGGDRPSLTGATPAEEIEAICAERAAAYASVADHSVRTDSRSMDEILLDITAWLEA